MSGLTDEQEMRLRIAALEAAALITAHHAQHVEVTDYADHCLAWLRMGISTDAADSTSPYASVNDQQGETK